MKKIFKHITPTVWIREDEEFYQIVKEFYEQGIENIRVNCTRHKPIEYIKAIAEFRKWCDVNLKFQFNIMLDLPIPNKKIRVFYDWEGKEMEIERNEKCILTRSNKYCDREKVLYTENSTIFQKTEIGEIIYTGEKGPEFQIIEKKDDTLKLNCLKPGIISYGKYITTDNLKYERCNSQEIESFLKMCSIVQPEKVAFSFINHEEDMSILLSDRNWICDADTIAKIETMTAVENLNNIALKCQEIMIGRGDLLINAGIQNFAISVNRIMEYCNLHNIKYYVATGILQYLDTELKKISRAELLDLYNILKFKDANVILGYGICKDIKHTRETLDLLKKLGQGM